VVFTFFLSDFVLFSLLFVLLSDLLTDINKKTLAIQLHGTLLTQVNAGPLAVAQTFLSSEIRENFSPELTAQMDRVFIDFVQLLADALSRQKPYIDTHEIPIQVELERSYFVFKQEICTLTNFSTEKFTETFSPPEVVPLTESINTISPNQMRRSDKSTKRRENKTKSERKKVKTTTTKSKVSVTQTSKTGAKTGANV